MPPIEQLEEAKPHSSYVGSSANGPESLSTAAYEGPKRFTPEEVADGNTGIRWVTGTYVAGRPTLHDVLDYIERRKEDMACTCPRCTEFLRRWA